MTYVAVSPVIKQVAWTLLGHFSGFRSYCTIGFKLSQRDRRIAEQHSQFFVKSQIICEYGLLRAN